MGRDGGIGTAEGGGSGRPSTAFVIPTKLDYGQVVVNESSLLGLTLVNNTSVSLTITGATFADGSSYDWVGITFPVVVNAGDTCALGNVRFLPTSLGAFTDTIFIAITGQATQRISCIGQGVNNAKTLAVDPLVLLFPNTLIHSDSAYQRVRITNNGGFKVSLTSITLTTGYEQLALSFSLPVDLYFQQYLDIYIRFSPESGGSYYDTHGITIAFDGTNSPLYIRTIGYCTLSDPSTWLLGFDSTALFSFASGSVTSLSSTATKVISAQATAANSVDLNCEEVHKFEKATQFGSPGMPKSLYDIFFKYEDLGVATIIVQALTRLKNIWKSISIGSIAADEAPCQARSENPIGGETIDLIFYADPNTGPKSFIEFIPRIEEGVEYLGNAALPSSIVAAHILQNDFQQCLFAFGSDADVALVKTTGLTVDLNCEEAQSLRKVTNFAQTFNYSPSYFESIGIEKMLAGVWFKYEDLGVAANIILDAKSNRESKNGDVIGLYTSTLTDPETIRQCYLDVLLSGEVLDLNLRRVANDGPLSIVEMLLRLEPKGGVVEIPSA